MSTHLSLEHLYAEKKERRLGDISTVGGVKIPRKEL